MKWLLPAACITYYSNIKVQEMAPPSMKARCGRAQIGGSDQMGNVVTGLDLIRRLGDGAVPTCFGLTFPLLTKADGTKMGKSASGAVWLSPGARPAHEALACLLTSAHGHIPQRGGCQNGRSHVRVTWTPSAPIETVFTRSSSVKVIREGLTPTEGVHARAGKLSPFQMYQFLLGSVPDADVCAFLRQLTFLPLADIAALEAQLGAPGYAPNTAQRLLAAEVTRFVHGEPGLQAALAATAVRLAPCCVLHRLLDAVCARLFRSLRRMPKLMRQWLYKQPH